MNLKVSFTWCFSHTEADVYQWGEFPSALLSAVCVWYLWGRAKEQADDPKHHLCDEDNPRCVFCVFVCVMEGSMWVRLHIVPWPIAHRTVLIQMWSYSILCKVLLMLHFSLHTCKLTQKYLKKRLTLQPHDSVISDLFFVACFFLSKGNLSNISAGQWPHKMQIIQILTQMCWIILH